MVRAFNGGVLLTLGWFLNIRKYMDKIKIQQHGFTAFSWFAGWLFTIGFLHLAFWKGVMAILLWPYYIGLAVGLWAQR